MINTINYDYNHGHENPRIGSYKGYPLYRYAKPYRNQYPEYYKIKDQKYYYPSRKAYFDD